MRAKKKRAKAKLLSVTLIAYERAVFASALLDLASIVRPRGAKAQAICDSVGKTLLLAAQASSITSYTKTVRAITQDLQSAYWNPKHLAHHFAVQLVQRYYELEPRS